MAFGSKNQGPCEAFAAEEQHRADGLARTIADIQGHPHSPLNNSLALYQMGYRDAAGNAAANTAQPQQ